MHSYQKSSGKNIFLNIDVSSACLPIKLTIYLDNGKLPINYLSIKYWTSLGVKKKEASVPLFRVKQKKSTFTSQKLDKLYTSYSDISWNKTERMPLLLIYQGHRSSVSSSSTNVQTCSGYLKLNFPLILGDHDDVDMSNYFPPLYDN